MRGFWSTLRTLHPRPTTTSNQHVHHWRGEPKRRAQRSCIRWPNDPRLHAALGAILRVLIILIAVFTVLIAIFPILIAFGAIFIALTARGPTAATIGVASAAIAARGSTAVAGIVDGSGDEPILQTNIEEIHTRIVTQKPNRIFARAHARDGARQARSDAFANISVAEQRKDA